MYHEKGRGKLKHTTNVLHAFNSCNFIRKSIPGRVLPLPSTEKQRNPTISCQYDLGKNPSFKLEFLSTRHQYGTREVLEDN